jgi:hypothetical protein
MYVQHPVGYRWSFIFLGPTDGKKRVIIEMERLSTFGEGW